MNIWPFSFFQTLNTKLDIITKYLIEIGGKENQIMGDLTALNAEIDLAATEIKAAIDALTAAVGSNDQAAIDAATQRLKDSVDALQAALPTA